ncbi:cytochrome C oxidase subunit IV family protein [Massilia luteola]|uniref:cytochrome C oxidase subunit IV family protein n=1 Tax=Massilia luteola TaxID=3081751 RepID=UPI002ACC259A|nr:cytochrome C oxidase subunit IV family protein [Massilia sp. Gc5]
MDKAIRPLVFAWIALMALLATTAGCALLRLGWLNTAISLAIALTKALLVAIVFMRLRRAPALLRLAAVAGAVTLALLFGLSLTDYATRPELKAPWQQPATVAPRFGSR